MKVIILTEGPFPYGMASTTRLVAYARGMVDAGAEVTVLCTKPTEVTGSPQINFRNEGEFKGIKFKYTPGITLRPKSVFRRILLYYSGFIKAKIELKKMSEESHIDILFMGLTNFWFTWSFSRWSRRNKVLFIQERSEYPFIGINGFWQKFKLWFYLRYTCKLFNGMIVITKVLYSYYLNYIQKDARIFLLPMLVESDRFPANNKRPEGLPENYMAYVGNMQGNKDGVPILIESYAIIARKYPDIHLVLIGDKDFDGFAKLLELIRERDLSDRVHFTGRIERDDLPAFLTSANYLVLARPDSKQAEGGFPNKLGEYLATGKPIIVTSVGEIPEYLTDGINAFISIPNDSVAFADKMQEALDDPQRSIKIGAEGRKLVETIFHPKMQAGKMLEFFTELIKDQF
ncbi:glycosyltransferase family 4 protein [Bacteroidota bacterium]